jgi:tetratricopeptide (TPR) repeat protein
MKKILAMFSFLLTAYAVFANDTDSILKKIAAEKNESKRFDLITVFFESTQDNDPVLDMQKAKELLQQSHEYKDPISEAMALTEIGYNYRSFGNTLNGLDYNIKSLAIAEQTGNAELIAAIKVNVALYYKDMSDFPKAVQILQSAEEGAAKVKSYKIQSWAQMNLGEVYNSMNKTDSALMYSQRAYESSTRYTYKDLLGFICLQLGIVHQKQGNASLAVSYYNLAVKDAAQNKSPKHLNQAYYALALFYQDINIKDSVILYAKKAISAVKNTSYSNMCIRPAKLLSRIYENQNSDSTVKYLKLFMVANDSLYNTKTIQQGQVLTFENELRLQELAAEKNKAEEQRWLNIQYALLAFSIIIFIIIFLLLSRGFITSERGIKFFGVVALLLVFEFLNLVLHPFLERVTHHTPALMLLGLVCIAAILVPLHHRLEKWATAKLVEKNKLIRLAAAKKTIEKLEGEIE